MGQWIREIDPRKYSRLTFDKEQRQHSGAKMVSSTMALEHLENRESRAGPDTFTEVDSKCITDLNVKCETVKVLGN